LSRDQAEYFAERQAEHRREGLCLWCDRPVHRAFSLCLSHWRGERTRRKVCTSAGICPRCKTAPTDGAWACEACRDEHNAARRRRRTR